MMARSDLKHRLHQMVDALFDGVPEDWLDEGVYPMLRITMRRGSDADEAFDLVVGLDRATDN